MAILNAVSSFGPGKQVTFAADTDFRQAEDITIVSVDDVAIFGFKLNPILTLDGYVYGELGAIFMANSTGSTSDARFNIGETAFIGASIANDMAAIKVDNYSLDLTNRGVISGGKGIFYTAPTASGKIINHGRIDALATAIAVDSETSAGSFRLENSGVIRGESFAYVSGAVTLSIRDTVINTGRMIGSVRLNDGNDRYDGDQGQIRGRIFGGDGDDSFAPGLGAETIFGGQDDDTLDFRAVGAVSVALDGFFAATGAAAGDIYEEIENILGSGTGADKLRGNGEANTLAGNGGDDTLSGGDGSDVLKGGSGKDRLIGGAGHDVFLFEKPGHGGDVITDFSQAAGQDDLINVFSADFGGGLSAGILSGGRFVARADNEAQDRTDRFVFRTTDKTLWFDVDGNGTAGPKLIVDLANNVNLTAADIFVDQIIL